jgi:hypothetical protein
MTLFSRARRQILDKILVSFLETLGDAPFSTLIIDPGDYPDVLPRTWTELAERGLLKVEGVNCEMYKLMPLGYVRALKISRCSDAS